MSGSTLTPHTNPIPLLKIIPSTQGTKKSSKSLSKKALNMQDATNL